MKIACILNELNETTIPIENFLALDGAEFDKVLIVLNATDEGIKEALTRNGLEPCVKVYGLKSKGFFNIILCLISILKNEKPGVIHGHHTSSSLISSVLAIFSPGIRSVFTVHSDFRYYKLRNKVAFLLIYFLNDKLVANSCNTKKSIPAVVPRKKISVIYNGVSTQRLGGSIGKYLPEKFIVGTISRLVPSKDHETLIRAFSKFIMNRDSPRDSKLYIVGGGKLQNKLELLVHDLSLSDRVCFTGSLPRSEAYSYLKGFNVFVVSSRFEGFCNAMAEAMFAKTPVISTDVEPLPEVLGRRNGIFYEVGNADSLADRLMKVYQDPGAALARSEAALQRAKENYSLDVCAKAYANLYLEASNDRK